MNINLIIWLILAVSLSYKPLYADNLKKIEPVNFTEPEIRDFAPHTAVNIIVGVHYSPTGTRENMDYNLDDLTISLPSEMETEVMCFTLSRREGGYTSSNSYDVSDSERSELAQISYPTKFPERLNNSQLSGVAYITPNDFQGCDNRTWDTVIPINWNASDIDRSNLVLFVNSRGERDVVSRITWKIDDQLGQDYAHCTVLEKTVRAEFDRICVFDLAGISAEFAKVTVRPETGGEGPKPQTITVLMR